MIGHADTYEEAVALINKLELPSGTKMAMKKDIKYGWTWASMNPGLLRNKKKDLPRFTLQTLNDDYIHISNQCLQEMASHARGRVRSTDQRIKAYKLGTTKQLSPDRIAENVSRRYPKRSAREQYDYALGLQKYFSDAGYGRTEVITQDTIVTEFDRLGATLDAEKQTRDRAEAEKQTRGSDTIRETGQSSDRVADTSLSETERRGPELQSRHSVVVRMANGRDGYCRKRITIHAGKAVLDGDL
jgi:hypothetical protein